MNLPPIIQSISRRLKRWVPIGKSPLIDRNALLVSLYHAKKDFFFLQIGANDGFSNDPIYSFITQQSPTGLLIEPQPEVFQKLEKTYPTKEFPNLRLINIAIGVENGSLTLYKIAPSFETTYREHYKPTANPSGITSIHKEHVKSFLLKVMPTYFRNHDIEQVIETVSVPAKTIDSLLEEENVTNLDFVQIDTEGFDAKIVHMLLGSHLINNPKIINFETKNLPTSERKEIYECLISHGYTLHEVKGDTFSIHQSCQF
ncbi:MAG: FkbM family methyltransferase [Opitutales bacterium]|nr:FkbM family methyltransferase [Opitutales bacterium]